MTHAPSPLGTPAVRREARDKVTGAARYAAEHTPPGCAYAWPVPATVARGRVTAVHADEVLALPGVLAVLTHENAPRLEEPDDPTLALLQSARVPHRGWYVALVVADTLENAGAAADALRIEYAREEHDVRLTAHHPGLYTPEQANGGHPAVRERGDFDTAFAAAAVRIDATYTMTALHNHPMEPHAATAWWDDGHLTVYDSAQGSRAVQDVLARIFGREKSRVTVVSEHVGGGFGSKGTPRPQPVLAAMAALHTGRPVKLALPRRQLAAVVGHRAPTVQRVRLGAGADGVITALAHEVITHTSTVNEFVEQAAVPARTMYTSPHSRTGHRVAELDVPTPSWMRAPGERPGCTPWSRRWTNSPSPPGWTRWNCGCATNPAPNPTAAGPSAAGTWPSACGRGPGASAGSGAIRVRASAAKGTCCWAPGWLPAPTPSWSVRPPPPRTPPPTART